MWVDSWVCPPVLCPPARPPLPFTPREDRPRFRPEGKQTGARSAEGFPIGFDPRPGHDVNRLFRSILLNHFAFFVDCFITVFSPCLSVSRNTIVRPICSLALCATARAHAADCSEPLQSRSRRGTSTTSPPFSTRRCTSASNFLLRSQHVLGDLWWRGAATFPALHALHCHAPPDCQPFQGQTHALPQGLVLSRGHPCSFP